MDEILKEVTAMESEQRTLKHEIFKICWYMRGSVSITEGFLLSYEDRRIINDIVKGNLETTKETHLPFF